VRRVLPWLVLAAATAGVARALDLVGVPSASLFGALLLGLAVALALPGRLAVPAWAFGGAQGVVGVVLGTYLQSSSLGVIGDEWPAVVLVSAATLGVSLAVGVVLARLTDVDAPTAAMGMIAGGASGIVTMARDLHGDDRLVAFMQYARVLVVVLLTPLLIPLLFPGHHAAEAGAAAAAPDPPPIGTATGWLWTLAVGGAGVLVALRVRLPSPMLLGPMILGGALTLSGATTAIAVPPVLRETAFALVGLQVGLRFTVATVRQVGRLLVPVLVGILALVVACFGLAAVLAAMTPVSLLDAYLATTPGGLYAVLAVALGAGANTTFIVAVQGLRVLVMVLLAPVAVKRLVGHPARA
jgi:membrane AbrB-like protein